MYPDDSETYYIAESKRFSDAEGGTVQKFRAFLQGIFISHKEAE